MRCRGRSLSSLFDSSLFKSKRGGGWRVEKKVGGGGGKGWGIDVMGRGNSLYVY